MRTIANLIRKVRRNAEDYNWWVAAKRSLAAVLAPVYEHKVYRIYKIDLDHAATAADLPAKNSEGKTALKRSSGPATTPSGDCTTVRSASEGTGDQFTFKVIGQAEHDHVEQVERYAEWLRGELSDKIAAGSVCLVALDGERVAGFNLVSFGEVTIPPLRRSRVFHEGQSWSEHIAVFPDYRKLGLATQIRLRMFEQLRQRGAKRLYGGTLQWNVPALRLARRLGFRVFVDGHYTRMLGLKAWRWTRDGDV